MSVLGYETGPIDCRAAFIADFDVPTELSIAQLVGKIDADRQKMDVRQGMRSKYVPLRFDPATGAHQIGGRYLFETWDDVTDYMRFTAEELEFEPGTKFWDRPFFSNIDKRAWRVVGAHDFTPLSTHYVSRFERFGHSEGAPEQNLEAAWPAVRDAARAAGLAGVWLLVQPVERQVGLVTAGVQGSGKDDAERASRSLLTLERMPSLIEQVPGQSARRSLFDRTSLNLSLWLPRSRCAGGEDAVFPTFPVHPRP